MDPLLFNWMDIKNGGKITIDFFSDDDLKNLLELIKNNQGSPIVENSLSGDPIQDEKVTLIDRIEAENPQGEVVVEIEDRSPEEIKAAENKKKEKNILSFLHT